MVSSFTRSSGTSSALTTAVASWVPRTIAISASIELDGLGVDPQEAEEGTVAEIHDSLDAGGDEDRRRGNDLREACTEFCGAGGECRHLTLRGAIDIRHPQHDEEGERARSRRRQDRSQQSSLNCPEERS